VKGGRIETSVRLPTAAILAKLDDKTGHDPSPEFTSLRRKLVIRFRSSYNIAAPRLRTSESKEH
jgi:hypothetical protein